MVRPVYQPVTIEAGLSNQPWPSNANVNATGQTCRAIKLAGMVGIRMTVLAQIGRPHFEEICVRRAMRIVAVGAVFAHRGMFPQERAALLRMATIAGVVDRGGFQQARPFAAAVRIVALGTFFRPIPARHHGVFGMAHLGTFGLMAGKADARTHCIADGMDVMAAGATHPAHIVCAAEPIGVGFVVLVATKTGAIIVSGRCVFIFERLNFHRAGIVVLTHHLDMRRPPAVTGLTASLRIAIKRAAMNACLESLHRNFVASKALRVINTGLIRPCVG